MNRTILVILLSCVSFAYANSPEQDDAEAKSLGFKDFNDFTTHFFEEGTRLLYIRQMLEQIVPQVTSQGETFSAVLKTYASSQNNAFAYWLDLVTKSAENKQIKIDNIYDAGARFNTLESMMPKMQDALRAWDEKAILLTRMDEWLDFYMVGHFVGRENGRQAFRDRLAIALQGWDTGAQLAFSKVVEFIWSELEKSRDFESRFASVTRTDINRAHPLMMEMSEKFREAAAEFTPLNHLNKDSEVFKRRTANGRFDPWDPISIKNLRDTMASQLAARVNVSKATRTEIEKSTLPLISKNLDDIREMLTRTADQPIGVRPLGVEFQKSFLESWSTANALYESGVMTTQDRNEIAPAINALAKKAEILKIDLHKQFLSADSPWRKNFDGFIQEIERMSITTVTTVATTESFKNGYADLQGRLKRSLKAGYINDSEKYLHELRIGLQHLKSPSGLAGDISLKRLASEAESFAKKSDHALLKINKFAKERLGRETREYYSYIKARKSLDFPFKREDFPNTLKGDEDWHQKLRAAVIEDIEKRLVDRTELDTKNGRDANDLKVTQPNGAPNSTAPSIQVTHGSSIPFDINISERLKSSNPQCRKANGFFNYLK